MRIGMALPQHGEYATRESIARVAREAGRDADALPIIARANATLADSPIPEAGCTPFAGTVAQWAEDVDWVTSLGIDHLFFAIDGPIERRLHAMAELQRLLR